MISASDALAFCLSQPGADPQDCRDAVAAQLVGGAYCDGDVVMVAGQPKRCVPSGVLAAKRAASAKTPLPPSTSSVSPWLVAGGLALAAGLVYIASR